MRHGDGFAGFILPEKSLFQNERQKIFVIPGKCNATRNPGSFLDYLLCSR
jgi:hypothetical protein